MLADLHLHTYFSDSTRSPEALALAAHQAGLGLIAVCDHDTVAAYPRLRAACDAQGLRLIQGAEFSANWGDLTLHILGLGFDPESAGIKGLIDHNQREYKRFDEVLMLSMMQHFPVLGNMQDYWRFERVPENGGWKNTNYMLARGLTKDVEDGYQYFPEHATYKPQFPALFEVCDAIAQAGGRPILAHPGNWWPAPGLDFEDILHKLTSEGVTGIECHYPSHSKELTARCLAFCRAHDLNVTAGSDDHGEFNRVIDGVLYEICAVMVDESQLQLREIV